MIKVKGLRTEFVEIELHERDILERAVTIVRKRRGLINVDTIDDNDQMYEHVEYATSHSWISKQERGKASEDQKEAQKAIKLLQKLSREE